MSITLVDIPTEIVAFDDRAPDRDDSHILEHLVRYCAKLETLPAITISLRGGVHVVRNHKYLLAAHTLGRARIRAVLAAPSDEEATQFLARPDVVRLDWPTIRAAEADAHRPRGWHVFFFERPLSAAEKQAFDATARELFADSSLDVVHDDTGPMAELEAPTPVEDEEWRARHLAAFARYHREHVPIRSFQGRRFPDLVR